jgi:uridine kinase
METTEEQQIKNTQEKPQSNFDINAFKSLLKALKARQEAAIPFQD